MQDDNSYNNEIENESGNKTGPWTCRTSAVKPESNGGKNIKNMEAVLWHFCLTSEWLHGTCINCMEACT
eukprot:1501303-Amphidinium_carterae.1